MGQIYEAGQKFLARAFPAGSPAHHPALGQVTVLATSGKERKVKYSVHNAVDPSSITPADLAAWEITQDEIINIFQIEPGYASVLVGELRTAAPPNTP